ncbi:MAG TPA: carboxypeptidase-like regulatory domain-containing protein, partial [Acidobacteriota bacterium]|nr:carboxypeptidase-like regulatory domain-containing protein [Acidobacteriota bacterium]
MRKTLWIGLLMLLSMPVLVLGQGATTAEFSGIILSSDEMPLPGAEITAVHVPTGTTYTTISRADGRFNIP